MKISLRSRLAGIFAAPVWVVPMAAVILSVSLVLMCVPAVEAG